MDNRQWDTVYYHNWKSVITQVIASEHLFKEMICPLPSKSNPGERSRCIIGGKNNTNVYVQ